MSQRGLSKAISGKRRSHEDGIALVSALLLLLLITGMTVAMTLSADSDMMINGYYRNYRGAFYAADSGLAIVRQDLVNRVKAVVPATLSTTTQPIPAGTEATVLSYINGTYGGSYKKITGSGQAVKSWPGQFKIKDPSFSLASCQVLGGGGTCASPTGTPTGYRYVYNYSMTSLGQSQGAEEVTLGESGNVTVTATLTPSGDVETSFSAWGMFIDHYDICDGGYLVPGTITGPVFTNGAWTFGDTGSYVFTDQVGSASSKFGYQFTGSGSTCKQSSSTSASNGSGWRKKTIAPTFAVSPKLNQKELPLPDNDYSQQRAVLDGKGGTGSVTNSDRAAVLRNVDKTKYSSSGESSGVWLPYSVDASTGVATFTGGGILVEGDAKVTLSTSGTTSQVYTIQQGGTTTSVTVNPIPGNPGAGTTTVVSGGKTLTINGVPAQISNGNAVMGNATMLYVDGDITAMSGPGQGQAAIQDGSAVTVTAAEDITITGDIRYKTRPVTLSANEIANTPASTLIPGNDNGQVLGVYTRQGDIRLDNSQWDDNLEIHGSLATISKNGSGGIVNVGDSIDNLTIVGGRIQNEIKNINSDTRNVIFDRRFAQGFGPPWFPSTTVTESGVSSTTLDSVFQRTQWVNQTSYK